MSKSRRHLRWLDGRDRAATELHRQQTHVMMDNHYDAEHIRQLKAEADKLRGSLQPGDSADQTHLVRRLRRVNIRLRRAMNGARIATRPSGVPHRRAPLGYDVEDRFAYLDNTLFNGQLPPTKIVFEPLHGRLGEVRKWMNDTYDIILNEGFDWTFAELDGVILHEMIHIDVAEANGISWKHDWVHTREEFQQRLAAFQPRLPFRIPITERTYDPARETPDQR